MVFRCGCIHSAAARRGAPALLLGALGGVGDIGTSPIYAFRASLKAAGGIPVETTVLMPLVFWAIVLVVALKYVVFVMRADNRARAAPWRYRLHYPSGKAQRRASGGRIGRDITFLWRRDDTPGNLGVERDRRAGDRDARHRRTWCLLWPGYWSGCSRFNAAAAGGKALWAGDGGVV